MKSSWNDRTQGPDIDDSFASESSISGGSLAMSVAPQVVPVLDHDSQKLKTRRRSWPPQEAKDDPVLNGIFTTSAEPEPPPSTLRMDHEPMSGSSYRPFDEILMEGASCGSVRALAVEAAIVANGILRRNGDQKSIQDDPATVTSRATVVSAKTLRKRRIASIFQHYYPEGGWGYVILLCGFLVQVFAHGFQLSFGILLPIIYHRFRLSDPTSAGKQL